MMASRLLENYRFPENVDSSLAPDGSCEIGGEPLFDGATGRRCRSDGLACFGFSDAVVYASCPTREIALKRQS